MYVHVIHVHSSPNDTLDGKASHLGHSGHADHVRAPRLKHFAFSHGREARSFHCQVSALLVVVMS